MLTIYVTCLQLQEINGILAQFETHGDITKLRFIAELETYIIYM
jgi:hypothetical protein